MIVKCDQCQSRFKIPDEKVTEKGVKVRCTKCQHTFRVKRVGGEAVNEAVAAPAAPKADPFAAFGEAPRVPEEMATRQMSFPEGIAATKNPAGLPPSPYASALFEEKTRVGPVPTHFGAGDDNPFEQATRVASIPRELAELNAAEALAAQAQKGKAASPFSDLPPTPAVPPAPLPARGGAPATPFADPFADPFGQDAPPAPEVTRKGPAPSAPPPAADSPFDFSNDATQTGSAATASPFSADPFGDSGGGESLELASKTKADDARAMFEMPTRPPPPRMEAPPPEPEPSSGNGAVAIGALKLTKPTARQEEIKLKDGPAGPGAVRRVSGLIGNLTMAAVLLVLLATVGNVYVNEGTFDLSNLSTDTIKEMLDTPSATLYAIDVSNGLYETREGKPVFFVRGDIENRGPRSTRAQVRAEILDGTQTIRHVDGFVGASPSPEELYGIASASDLAALQKKLAEQVLRIEPGTRASFVLIFYDYPPDLSGYRLKVTATEVEEKSAAR